MAWNVIFSTRSVDERLAKAEDRMDLLHKENKILTERIAAREQRGPSTAGSGPWRVAPRYEEGGHC